ncbi:MAG: peptide ABC transporter substrate-binding protein [Erysipelotrichaceae bacterium]|nr:peptide ABC transporter substrate-binding protein [Erysipelotrichaceae bacterium]
MKKIKKVLCLLLCLLLMVGCSSGGNEQGQTSSGSTGGESVVRVAQDTDLSTMDHHIATDATSFIAQSMMFSGLTALDKNNQPVPELAKSWDVSEDGLVYTFHLVDAKWADGTPVTANDFVYAWQRLANPDTASEYAFILSTINLVNADKVTAGELPVDQLGVKAVDDKTFEVTLDLPCNYLLSLMAFPSFFPMNQAFTEAQGDQYSLSPANLLACGPYVMESWTPGNSWVFVKNDQYFKADEITTEKVEFKFIQDTQSAMLEYQSGNLDVVKLMGEQVAAYQQDPEFTNRLEGYLWYLSINFTNEKFQNDNLRKALALAVDRETIATNVLKDGSIAAEGLVPVALSSDSNGVDFRESAGLLTSYDPAEAAKYYEKAKEELGGDVTIDLLFEDTEASKAVAEYIQNNWETNLPGLTVTLNSKPKKTRLDLMRSQDYEVGLTRWGPDYADPQTYLDLFISDNLSNNVGRYKNADYDAKVIAGTAGEDAANPEARWQDFIDAEKIIVDTVGVIPVYQNGGAYMIKSNVKGIEFHSAGVDSYRNITVE